MFFGYRLFRAVLPVFGFVLGAIVGAQAVFLIFDEGIFATVLSIVTAVVVGLVFGVLAYFFWALGVILVDRRDGLRHRLRALAGLRPRRGRHQLGDRRAGRARASRLRPFVLRLPRAIVTVVTALWGAGATLGGVMVLLQIIEPEELGYGGVDAVVSESFIWLLAFIALAVVGAIFQAMTSAEIDTIWVDEPSSSMAPPPSRTGL